VTIRRSINDVVDSLKLPDFDATSAQQKMAPVPRMSRRPADKSGDARLGGVLVLLYCRDSELYVILTRRRDDLQSHAGQVSFPGGRNEAPETLLATALRETHEEVGINPQMLGVLGELTPLYIFPSDYEVHPFVGCLSRFSV
jgi:8-oxo-dGTP pyrophosphatase MutT (NUDIX family)